MAAVKMSYGRGSHALVPPRLDIAEECPKIPEAVIVSQLEERAQDAIEEGTLHRFKSPSKSHLALNVHDDVNQGRSKPELVLQDHSQRNTLNSFGLSFVLTSIR